MSTIAEALDWGKGQLKDLDNPVLESEVLLCAVLSCERVWLKAHGDTILSEDHRVQFEDYIDQRGESVPVAYILGYKDWAGMRLKVNQSVLIPRDETEVLCDHILKDQPGPKVLDIGTGSGAIACFFARMLENPSVTAIDISLEALNVAKENALNLSLSINFVQSDLLFNIDDESSFDVVVANLPYVPDKMSVSAEVGKEPELALFSGVDGLNHYRSLVEQLEAKRIDFKGLWLEFLPQQKDEVKRIFEAYSIEFFTDSGSEVFFAKIS